MKSKEFIELIQKADPSGEAELDMCINYAAVLPGYYDGNLKYYDEKTDSIHITRTAPNGKLRIYEKSIEDIVWDNEGKLEEIFKHIVIDDSENRKNEILNL